jgi:hypothetical protein
MNVQQRQLSWEIAIVGIASEPQALPLLPRSSFPAVP